MKAAAEAIAVFSLFVGAIIGGSDGPHFPVLNYLGAGIAWTITLVSLFVVARHRGGI